MKGVVSVLSTFANIICFTTATAISSGLPEGRTSLENVALGDPNGAYFPAESQSSELIERETGGYIYLHACSDVNWAGTCLDLYAPYGICFNFAYDWNDKISSARTDGTTDGQCILFKDVDCRGTTLNILHGGVENFVTEGFNDEPSSFKCSSSINH